LATSRDGRSLKANRINRFFVELEAREHDPLLSHLKGTLRFDLLDKGTVENWYVTINGGGIQVARDGGAADVIFSVDRALFAAMTEGKANAFAAVLRGDVQVAGDLALAMAFERVFPGPPDSVGPNTPSRQVEPRR
jgi:hypothetical protein